MLPLDVNRRWMPGVKVVILFYGVLLKDHMCGSSDTNEMKNMVFVRGKNLNCQTQFPSDLVYQEDDGLQLCFDCCDAGNFICSPEQDSYCLILNEDALSKQDIVVIMVPDDKECMPSDVYKKAELEGFLFSLHKCLYTGIKSIRLSQDGLCGKKSTYDAKACKGLAVSSSVYTVIFDADACISCKLKEPDISIVVPDADNSTTTSPDKAVHIMGTLSSFLDQLGNSTTAAITIGNIKGVIAKLPLQNHTSLTFGFEATGDVNILEENSDLVTSLSRSVHIPTEAVEKAVKGNGSFAGVMLFPGVYQDNPNSFFLNNEVVGIEMGAQISNLSQTIDIQYSHVTKSGRIASCRSWDGNVTEWIWITDGCQTKEFKDSITCQCSHLTFFAILLSPPSRNMSASDLKSLTYITSVGCGLSVFFLAVALFIHCLLRKQKASQATQLLMNLFVAMFTLNLSFLTNESIANLGNFGACVVIAAVLHYSMLATVTWFLMQALHLYFGFSKSIQGKHYMMSICIAGWVTPAVVVVTLLALQKYDYMGIYIDDGTSKKLCWIPDAAVLQGVNVGYYALVFVFTFGIFIITVQQIARFKSAAGGAQDKSTTKANVFSILGLFLLLGITWAFAFFSHGPLLLPSYYIFTILNSFQGFFLFIYYYKSSKAVGADNLTHSSVSMATTSKVLTSPYE